MNLNDDDVIRGVVAKAIFENIGDEKREKIMVDAISQLLSVKPDSYGRAGKSPLGEIFEQVVYNRAREVVAARLDTDPTFKAALEGIISDAVKKMVEGSREKIVTDMADIMSRGIAALYR